MLNHGVRACVYSLFDEIYFFSSKFESMFMEQLVSCGAQLGIAAEKWVGE